MAGCLNGWIIGCLDGGLGSIIIVLTNDKIHLQSHCFNPIPARVLENQDTLGEIDPSLNPMLDVKILEGGGQFAPPL